MTATELKERRKKTNAKIYKKRKKELKNNMTLNSFIVPKKNLPEAEKQDRRKSVNAQRYQKNKITP